MIVRVVAIFLVTMVAASASDCSRSRRAAPTAAPSPSPAVDSSSALKSTLSLDDEGRYEQAGGMMLAFAERTGLTGERPERRYLWTDAFAVCNYLGLAQATGRTQYEKLALELVDRVHHVLGKHRPDDRRSGWISGLEPQQGEAHPTRNGLRIGKELPERAPTDPFDADLEWDRDGQYFHYLTKWMHALDQTTRATGQPLFNLWGRELAVAAHRAFVYPAGRGERRRMYWKMSIDLSHPLVRSMGQHDPLDGYVTCAQLRGTASRLASVAEPSLDDAEADFASMIDRDGLETSDPLGLGGLLADAYRLAQLAEQGAAVDAGLQDSLLEAARGGLERYARQGDLEQDAQQRLAFRELGLAIGLHAVAAMRQRGSKRSRGSRRLLDELAPFDALRTQIVTFWEDAEHRQGRTWTEHLDNNEVMLTTALAPEGFLVLRPVSRPGPSALP